MRLISEHTLSMTPLSVDGKSIKVNTLPVTAPAGASRIVVELPASSVKEIGFIGVDADAHLCIRSVQVGSIVTSTGASTEPRCAAVDGYGLLVDRAACGKPWDS